MNDADRILELEKEVEGLKRFRALRTRHNEEMQERTMECVFLKGDLGKANEMLERAASLIEQVVYVETTDAHDQPHCHGERPRSVDNRPPCLGCGAVKAAHDHAVDIRSHLKNPQ